MTIQLTPELEKRISERVQQGEFDSPDAAVERAVAFFLDFETDEMSAGEFLEVKAAIEESLGQIERGESISLADFDAGMRSRYGIPR